MSEPTNKSWFFMRDYQAEPKSDTVDNEATALEILMKRLDKLNQKVKNLDTKLDRLIQSNKSLIAYFSAVNERDVRDLNFKIRGFSSRNQCPPIGFVPERSNDA